MFWLDRVFEEARTSLREKIAAGTPLVIRDEKTASGRVHVGSLRALVLHAALKERFDEEHISSTFLYEINDFDVMDGLPVYLDAARYTPHMGELLFNIPSPEPSAPNFAEYFGREYEGVIRELGYTPTFYRSSELYLSGRMNGPIRAILEHADVVRNIYKEVSGSVRPLDWFAISVVCEQCGKVGTTKVHAFDGTLVSYRCLPNAVSWAKGCGHEGQVSPFDGRAKLPWKVEWPAKWVVMDVSVEGGGKDHYSKGGARDVAEAISRHVFKHEPPFGVPNEFFLIAGKKMSSSKGQGSSAREIADIIPPHILRLALLAKDINKQSNFDPSGDTVPLLFDHYDALAEHYWQEAGGDESRLFLFIHPRETPELLRQRFLPKFSLVAFLIQMPHLSLEDEIARLKGSPLTDADRAELSIRVRTAKQWLSGADESYRFTLAENLPETVRHFSPLQKQALVGIATFINDQHELHGPELHAALHDIRKRLNIPPADFFGALYGAFLGKSSGPKAGWFLSVLNRDFVLKRLTEASV